MMTRTVAELVGVSKDFNKGATKLRAVEDLHFSMHEGERVAIVGETGSGKSTALSMLLGLTAPTAGSVEVLGVDPFHSFQSLAGKIGIIFQGDRLLPWRTATANAAYGLEILGVGRSERRDQAHAWLNRLGLSGFHDAYPHELSGGMRQRVAIARTMCIEPELLFADEAFSALDEITAASVRNDLIDLLEDTHTTTLFVTHSVPEAAAVAHRVVVFQKPGCIAAEFPVRQQLNEGVSPADIAEEIRNALRSSNPMESNA